MSSSRCLSLGCVSLLVFLAWLSASRCPADGGAEAGLPSEAEIRGEIFRLGDVEFEIREAAQQRLLSWGLLAPDRVLEMLPQDGDDLEVVVRCDVLRSRLSYRAARNRLESLEDNDPELMAAWDAALDAPGERTFHALIAEAGGRRKGLDHAFVLLLARDNPLLNVLVLRALGGLDDRLVSAQVELCLSDPDPGIRLEAAGALGRLGASEATASLARALRDPAAIVRVRSLQSLSDLKADGISEAVIECLEDKEDVRATAMDAIGKIRLRRAIPRLAGLLESPDPLEASRAAVTISRVLGEGQPWGISDACAWWGAHSQDAEFTGIPIGPVGE